MFQVLRSDTETFSVLDSARPVYLTIKLHAGTKEFYQLHKLTKNKAFHTAGDQILIQLKKRKKERKRWKRGR